MQTVHKSTRNPFRILRALWRVTRDLGDTESALLVEMTFFKSRALRQYARWEESARELRATSETAEAFKRRPRIGTIDIDALSRLPEGTLGHTFATYLLANGLNPYLFEPIADGSDGDFVMAHLLETHDIWHIVTGFGTDVAGEFALVAFYAAQTNLISSSMLLTIGFANTTFFTPTQLRDRIAAVAEGWNLGLKAVPLFGNDWNELWDVPLDELRAQFGLVGPEPQAEHSRAA